ncbi:MAG: hypothetical protein ACRDVC_08755 [Acidimicrobiales bacterium]
MQFSTDDIEEGLRSLVAELVSVNAESTIHVVGGAAVALLVGREELTRDVDTLHNPSPAIGEAVKRVAHAKGWPETWLNDSAKMYDSHFHTEADWEPLIEDNGVIVCIAGPKLLLAMKLLAGRGRRDETDIERLLDTCEISSLDEAIAVFDHYYPTEVIKSNAMRQLESRFSE